MTRSRSPRPKVFDLFSAHARRKGRKDRAAWVYHRVRKRVESRYAGSHARQR